MIAYAVAYYMGIYAVCRGAFEKTSEFVIKRTASEGDRVYSRQGGV